MSGTVSVSAGGGGAGVEGRWRRRRLRGRGPGAAPPRGTAAASVVARGLGVRPHVADLAADTEVTLTFDNRDDAAVAGPHNVSIYDGDTSLFTGDLIEGPAAVDYTILPMPAGTYEFRCDVHPTMIGSVEVT